MKKAPKQPNQPNHRTEEEAWQDPETVSRVMREKIIKKDELAARRVVREITTHPHIAPVSPGDLKYFSGIITPEEQNELRNLELDALAATHGGHPDYDSDLKNGWERIKGVDIERGLTEEEFGRKLGLRVIDAANGDQNDVSRKIEVTLYDQDAVEIEVQTA